MPIHKHLRRRVKLDSKVSIPATSLNFELGGLQQAQRRPSKTVSLDKGEVEEDRDGSVVVSEGADSEPEDNAASRCALGTRVKQYIKGRGWVHGSVVAITQGSKEATPAFTVLFDNGEVSDYVENELRTMVAVGQVCLGSRIAVYWGGDEAYYPARVVKVDNRKTACFFITYEDNESEWVDLRTETFCMLNDEDKTDNNNERHLRSGRVLNGWKRTDRPERVVSDESGTCDSSRWEERYLFEQGNEKQTKPNSHCAEDPTLSSEKDENVSNSRLVNDMTTSSEKTAVECNLPSERCSGPSMHPSKDKVQPSKKKETESKRSRKKQGTDDSDKGKDCETTSKTRRLKVSRTRSSSFDTEEESCLSENSRTGIDNRRADTGRRPQRCKVLKKLKEKHGSSKSIRHYDSWNARTTNEQNCLLQQLKVGKRVSVYWAEDDRFYTGVVSRIRDFRCKKPYFIEYDDGDNEWIDLADHVFDVLPDDRKGRGKRESSDDDSIMQSKRRRASGIVSTRLAGNDPPLAAPSDISGVTVGSRVAIWWEEESKFYKGTLTRRRRKGKPFFIQYDDGDEEWLDLAQHKYILIQSGNLNTGHDADSESCDSGERDPGDCDFPGPPSIQVGSRLSVWWPVEKEYFDCTVTKRRDCKKGFYLEYDDGDREWLDLNRAKYKVLKSSKSSRDS